MAADRGTGDFGGTLKAARERRGIGLPRIAAATKISVAALEALERNDISRLPGGLFSRAFVRAYAIEVGLDPDETLQQFVARFPEAAAASGPLAGDQQQVEEAHESNQQTAAAFVRLIAISVPIVAALLYLGSMETDVAPPPPSDTSNVTTPAPDAGALAPAPSPPAPAAGATPAGQPPATASSSGEDARVAVAVMATGPCWVSAIVDGERVVAREFQTGERMTFDVGRSVVLTAGDAAALAVTINGEDARSLGAAGQVVTVRVTPTNFKSFLAAP